MSEFCLCYLLSYYIQCLLLFYQTSPVAPACPDGESLVSFCAADTCTASCSDPHKVKICIQTDLDKREEEKEAWDSSSMLRVPSYFMPDSVELCVPSIAAQALISIGHADCGACEPE